MIVDIVEEDLIKGKKITIHAEGFMPFAKISFRSFQQYSLRKLLVFSKKNGTQKTIQYYPPAYLDKIEEK
jgi:hypothetical protein